MIHDTWEQLNQSISGINANISSPAAACTTKPQHRHARNPSPRSPHSHLQHRPTTSSISSTSPPTALTSSLDSLPRKSVRGPTSTTPQTPPIRRLPLQPPPPTTPPPRRTSTPPPSQQQPPVLPQPSPPSAISPLPSLAPHRPRPHAPLLPPCGPTSPSRTSRPRPRRPRRRPRRGARMGHRTLTARAWRTTPTQKTHSRAPLLLGGVARTSWA